MTPEGMDRSIGMLAAAVAAVMCGELECMLLSKFTCGHNIPATSPGVEGHSHSWREGRDRSKGMPAAADVVCGELERMQLPCC